MSTLPAPPLQPRAPAPGRTSLVGPVVLTVLGVLLLVGAAVVAAVTAGGFVGAVRTDVLTGDGRPGPAVLAWADAPGTTSVDLVAGERYAVHLTVPRDAVGDDERPDLQEHVLLLAPSGAVVEADRSPGVSTRTAVRDRVAATVGAFTAPETGTYEMTVPVAGVPDAWVAVAPDKPFGPFLGSVAGSVLGVFVVLGLGAAGFGATLAGVIWWALRARARRAQAASAS